MAPRQWVWIIGALLVLGCSVASAEDESQISPAHSADRVDELMGRYNLHPAFRKLGRGLSNIAGGWLEVPLNVQKRYEENNTVASLFTGTVYGFVKGIARTGVGAYETVTFFLPYPEDFAPILPTLEYFQRKDKRKPLLFE